FFPDSLILDAGPSQDFRENQLAATEAAVTKDSSSAGMDAAAEESSSNEEMTAAQGELAQKEDMEMEVIVLEAPDGSSGDSLAVRQAWFQVRRAP
ncbi:MAG: hypothetical protein IJ441_08115, partial [Spirochaetaceae bacterium]|nr:hypothetical protein [Spirochaetaceae bacterium]